jgi:putative protein kinase ArgK-like GTPase of G3E family
MNKCADIAVHYQVILVTATMMLTTTRQCDLHDTQACTHEGLRKVQRRIHPHKQTENDSRRNERRREQAEEREREVRTTLQRGNEESNHVHTCG